MAAETARVRDVERYRSALFDLDGTLYLSGQAIPGAAEFVAKCRSAGLRVGFVTNISSKPRHWVLERLKAIGIAAAEDELVCAPDAVALALIRGGVSEAAVIGGRGLREALVDASITVSSVDDLAPASVDPGRHALAVGIDPDVTVGDLGRAALLMEAGLPVYAVSTDPRFPTSGGMRPGTGVVVAALRSMVPFEPVVCGKPSAIMGDLAREVLGEDGPTLVVGDSLVTDVPWAAQQGWDSLLVLTGATGPKGVADATARPTFVEPDLRNALRHGFSDSSDGDTGAGSHIA